MAQLNDLLVLGDTNLQGDVVSQSNVTAPKFIGALQGNANTATALTSNAGSANTPIYFANGKPTACSYTLAKSVPADAKFTDTVYTLPAATSSALGGVKIGSNITLSSGTISLTKANVTSALGYTPPTTDTDTGATSVEVTGSGSAVTAASYDAATRKLTLTKGSTFNNYSLPTATTSALGGVKAGATITSSSGYTACPILNGVLYYKDTKYTLSSFDITATATELNYTDGVTSNIQTQLDDKLPLSGGTVTGNILFSNSSTQPNQPNLKWKTIKNNSNVDRTPYVGYCTASSDGTFMVGSLEGTNYTTGLAIGGSSGNLLWKSKPVVTPEKILAGANTSVTSDNAGNVTIAATDTTYTAGTGLTLSGTDFRVTASDASEIMNQLSEGSSDALPDDYLIAQYAGGGSTTKTYHRRKVKNIITGDNVKAALGTGTETTKFLRNDGTWQVPPDTKVTQTVRTTNGNFPMLLRGTSAGTSTTTTTTSFGTGITANPSTNTITATTFNGTATKAAADANGNNIASTYLTVSQESITKPTSKGTFYNGLSNLYYHDTSVTYLSLYVSRDGGFTWEHYYDNTLTKGTVADMDCGNGSITQIVFYNVSKVQDDGKYYCVTYNDYSSSRGLSVPKPQRSLDDNYTSGKWWNGATYCSAPGTLAAYHWDDTGDICYIGLVGVGTKDYASISVYYNVGKSGSANYNISRIGYNYVDSATTTKVYYYFFNYDCVSDTPKNVQRIYRIVETFTYSTGENTYAQTTLTSGYTSAYDIKWLVNVDRNAFIYFGETAAQYNAGEGYITSLPAIINAAATTITLPQALHIYSIKVHTYSGGCFITGQNTLGANVTFHCNFKASSYVQEDYTFYQVSGLTTPIQLSYILPFAWSYNTYDYFYLERNGGIVIKVPDLGNTSVSPAFYLHTEQYDVAHTFKNTIYCNGTKIGELYQ